MEKSKIKRCKSEQNLSSQRVFEQHLKSSLTDDSFQSLKDDDSNDSLGLLSDEKLNTLWYNENETDELLEDPFRCEPPVNVSTESSPIQPKCKDISPIPNQKKSAWSYIGNLESTPKLKENNDSVYEENILNKTVKISSVRAGVEANFSPKEFDTNLSLETNSQILHETFETVNLNKTFETLNLNKTLPSIIPVDDNLSAEENLKVTETKIIVELNKTIIKDKSSVNKNITQKIQNVKNKIKSHALKNTQSMKDMQKNKLSNTNLDLKISKDDTNRSISSGRSIDKKIIPPHNIRGKCASKHILLQKVPINLSFQKVLPESSSPQSQKEKDKFFRAKVLLKNEDYLRKKYQETSRVRGHSDYKLSKVQSIKELNEVKRKLEPVPVSTFRQMEVPSHSEQKRQQNIISRSPQKSGTRSRLPRRASMVERPQLRSQRRRNEDEHVPPLPRGVPGECKEMFEVHIPPLPQRMPGERRGHEDEHVPPLPRGMPGEPEESFEVRDPSLHLGIPREPLRRRSIGGNSRIPTLGRQAFGAQAIFGTNPFGPPVRGRSAIPKKKPSGPKKNPWNK